MLDNWINIAQEVGAIDENGNEWISSSKMAREAIEIILGKENLKEAVRYYVAYKPGRELLRGVLWQLHPYSAMEECYKIFQESENIEEKRDAVELLRVVADERALKWIPEFLEHEDSGVQNWGIGIVDQLVFSRICHQDDVVEILDIAIAHPNKYVREKSEEIYSRLSIESKLHLD
jgi:hypothetical protein